jgi:hypothetical protein
MGSAVTIRENLPGIGHNKGPAFVEERRDSASARDDYRVIRWKDWYTSKGFSKWTANRLRKAGKGPRIVQLTEYAIGVTVKDDREWTEARTQAGA